MNFQKGEMSWEGKLCLTISHMWSKLSRCRRALAGKDLVASQRQFLICCPVKRHIIKRWPTVESQENCGGVLHRGNGVTLIM